MNRQDYLHLQAERKFLNERLAALPEKAWVTRQSTESRLRAIETELGKAKVDEREPARAQLTFTGRPVVGNHGIFAEFGAAAVGRFTEAVVAVAASFDAPLAAMGPIPNREKNRLLITSTIPGSFGFELEEYRTGDLPLDGPSRVAQALEQIRNLLQGTIGSDDELADSATETDPRALEKVRAFLQILADNQAACTLQYGEKTFRFSDVGQVRRSLERLSQDLRETEQVLEGEFQGLLSKSRTFQFNAGGDVGVITGKVSNALDNLDRIHREMNYRQVRIRVLSTQVGNGRPRYLLLEAPHLLEPAP
ncbi:MAG: hypothetical protein U1F76_15580 [Candidatus Competibacteraceae bacterium]